MKRTRLPKKDYNSRVDRLPKLTELQKTSFAEREKGFSPAYHNLKRKLLSFGGVAVVPVFEEDLKKIKARAQLFVPDGEYSYRFERGHPSDCHSNVAGLWDLTKGDVRIVTGWALSDDGLWRQHTWGLRYGTIIETTVKRKKYFGYILNEAESEKFFEENW